MTSLASSCQLGSLIPSRERCLALLCPYLRLTSCTSVRSIARVLLSQTVSERNHSSLEVNMYISSFSSVCLAEDFDPAVEFKVSDCRLAVVCDA